MTSDLLVRPALELAGMVRRGELKATELVRASLDRIEKLQPLINAFTHVAHDSALATAAEIGPGDPRPFAGVPVAIKDNVPVAGMPVTLCSDLFGDYIAPVDAFLVRRLRDAGFVIVGKTTLPEMGILPTTEPRRFGPTRNPWALERTPGGSSGGSAAAVAAGMVPIAHGNDGGGSIRIPAACCGLLGLKPARGRVSPGPMAGQSFLSVEGVLTRTTADTAFALDVLAGYELGDANWAPSPEASYGELFRRDPGAMRIAVALAPPLEGAALDPVHERGVRDAAALLESLGHEVHELAPRWEEMDLLPDFTRVFGSLVSMSTMIGGRLAGRSPTPADVEPLTWALWERSREHHSIEFLSAVGRLEAASRSIVRELREWDAVLTPALAERPVPIGEIHGANGDPWGFYQRSTYFTPYLAIANITGAPGISIPLYQGDDGLPTAIHLFGRPAREDLLLRLAAQLEQVSPWAGRLPDPEHGAHRPRDHA